jgi:23S rRNA pseudouridine1911/1915/1917 synthase
VPNTFPEIPIIFEDDDLLVINKPAGIVVNRSQTTDSKTIQDWVEERWGEVSVSEKNKQTEEETASGEGEPENEESVILGDPKELFKERSGIIHRLDKETSGVMMIAKNPEALVGCMTEFKLRRTEKKYLALAHGKLQPSVGTINAPIARNSRYRLQFAVRDVGRESITEYKVLQFFAHLDVLNAILEFKKNADAEHDILKMLPKTFKRAAKIYQGFSLVELAPKTGRTHQIRVHLAHINHPIVGDKVYSGSKRRLTDQVWCHRHFLHASSLKITHFRTKDELNFEAPLPADLEKALSFLTD